jgi:hypothetical protein
MKLPWMKKEGSDTEVEVSLPDDVKTKLDASAKAAEELPLIKEQLKGLDKINQFIDAFKADQDAEKQKKQRQQQQEQSQQTDSEINDLILTDPKKAIEMATQGHVAAIKAVHADNVRREVFEDSSKFPYYHGDIKREVDALIASQGVDFRLNPQNIENCYNTVIGKHTPEIVEGKIKNRFAAAEGGARGTSTGSAGDTGSAAAKAERAAGIAKDPQVIRAAKQVGISVEDYAKMLEEDGVEYA